MPHATPSAEPAPLAPELNPDSAFSRLWRGFMTARVAIALGLLLLLGALHTLAPALNISRWVVGFASVYLVAVLAVRIFSRPLPPGQTFDPQWVSTIGVDLITFSTLQFLQTGGINYSPLFALPVLMAAVLGSPLLALGTAAGATLLLLADAWVVTLHVTGDTAARFLQAGLTGTGYFALAVLVNQLSLRLVREERAARAGQQAARLHAQVNELVIEALTDGVLVVDPQYQVHAANPAARVLLAYPLTGASAPFALDARPAWGQLVALAQRTFEQRAVQVDDVVLEEESVPARRIHVRTRLTTAHDGHTETLCVMFLEDLREMEDRLRTAKLAAMGRMSAAVAHEIRNPLAAITQANALMEEDLREPALQQLSALVRKNAQRLARIVDEILDIARVQQPGPGGAHPLELDPSVATACGDWMLQNASASRTRLDLAAPGARVAFEEEHLRRILVNLLDNALRYAGDKPDSIRVFTIVTAGQASLHVWSDGAPLDPNVQQRLFEPFSSSRSRSSGLGLYICRELCERHGAVVDYRRSEMGRGANARAGNEFVISFASRSMPLAGEASFDTIAA